GGRWADAVSLSRGGRVARAGMRRRVARAAHRRIEQRNRKAAVNGPDRVVEVLARLALEDRPALLHLDAAEAHCRRDRRRRELAGEDVPEQLEATPAGRRLRHLERVLPADRARAFSAGLHFLT